MARIASCRVGCLGWDLVASQRRERHRGWAVDLDGGLIEILGSRGGPKVAAERLGHADPVLLLSLYSHVTPNMQRDAARAIGDSLFRTPPEAAPRRMTRQRAVRDRLEDELRTARLCRTGWTRRGSG